MSAGDAPGAPLSVALLTYSTKPRGGVVHTVELAEALHDLGVSVCIYALNKDQGGFYRPPRCPAVLVPAAPPPEGIDAVVRQRIAEFEAGLRRLGARHDIWHSQDCISANALAALRAEGRVPHFLRTVHHLDDYDSPYLRACQERSVREADACLVVSEAWRRTLRADLGVDAAIVPNGVSLRRYSPAPDARDAELRARLDATGSPLFVTVGGVEPRKNSIGLLKAFLSVRRRLPGAQLIIAGGETLFDYAPYQREFEAIAREHGVFPAPAGAPAAGARAAGAPPPLVLAGVLPDALIPPLYRLADAFVFPSVREGFGLVLLEAMASGAPVVSSAQPPFTEFLRDGESALLVDPSRTEDLAAAMEAILEGGVRRRLRAAAIEAAARYTWERSARIAAGVYREFLGSRHN
ncbi:MULTISPECIES: MSMEG_0565 family glycosyltransferase [Sorangium]|uniref:Glycosyl transferase family 1 n=1 Tax=Sorangium cellulosum TaxID=56 RepID=A0A4V0NHY6_SORCE|nr:MULTISPECIES: MSMEG_0565 family glycosyltransferase [Sorangium]AUX38302.1 glycosyl transferase family 1 [Sorangium cellulosum]WCQ97589.1 D-inositol 3-phosphate glycosyltransferase [Sorangium sp. Soce836]